MTQKPLFSCMTDILKTLLGDMLGEQRGERWISRRKLRQTQTFSFLREGLWDQTPSLRASVHVIEPERGDQEVWSKRKGGLLKRRFLGAPGWLGGVSI